MIRTRPDSSPVLKSSTDTTYVLKKKCLLNKLKKLFGIIFSVVLTGEIGRVHELHVERAASWEREVFGASERTVA